MPNPKVRTLTIGGVTYDLQDNISGYITGIISSDVTTALGFTPYNATNPNGYTSNTGTITSVKTTAGTHTTINVSSGAANFNVPTKTSHLTNDSGFISSYTETDPVFMASAAAGITATDISNWNAKPSTDTNTTYTFSNVLASHKFTSTLTAGGSGSGTSTATMEFVAGTGITLTDDTTNKKLTIACSVTNTDENVKYSKITTNQAYSLMLSGLASSSDTSPYTSTLNRTGTLTYNPSTKALITGGTVDGYTLAAASAKAVDSSISAGSSSANLPTSAAVASFVEGKGYLTLATLPIYDGTVV